MAAPNIRIRNAEQSVPISSVLARRMAAIALVQNSIPATNEQRSLLESGVRTDPFNVPSLGATARYVSSDPPAANEYTRRVRGE